MADPVCSKRDLSCRSWGVPSRAMGKDEAAEGLFGQMLRLGHKKLTFGLLGDVDIVFECLLQDSDALSNGLGADGSVVIQQVGPPWPFVFGQMAENVCTACVACNGASTR